MIGQETLLQELAKTKPRNMIVVGANLSGRKTLIEELSYRLNIHLIKVEHNVASIKDINLNLDTTIFMFDDLDTWSKACYSALLKPLEENEKHYFWITCNNQNSLPQTILSRCLVYHMLPYTKEEIGNEYCNSPGQAKIFSKDMLKFANKVIDNINAPIANVFKLEEKLALKAGSKGYDLELFFKLIEHELYSRISRINSGNTDMSYYMLYYITAKYHSVLNLKSINKQKLLWNWILDMRGESDGWKTI